MKFFILILIPCLTSCTLSRLVDRGLAAVPRNGHINITLYTHRW